MIDLIKSFVEYIKDNEKPLSRKVIIGILLLFGLIILNEYTGFTYYYPIGKEVEIISDIELAKASTKDTLIINFLNEKEKVVINRKYLHERFLELFKRNILNRDVKNYQQKEVMVSSTTFSEKISRVFPPMPYRSQLWHTLSSTFIFIIGSIIAIIVLIVQPFRENEKVGILTLIAIWIFSILLFGGVIWIIQFLFGLIPVILDRAYINYSIAIALQLFYVYWAIKNTKNKH